MRGGATGKLSLTLLFVLLPLVAASLTLGAYLNYASVRNTYIAMVGDRMTTLARRIAGDAQVALSMGLPLHGQDPLERTLVRERQADRQLASIDIVSAEGEVLFSSDSVRRGIRDRPDPALAERRSVPIVSAFDTVEGAVLVRVSREALDRGLVRLWSGITTAVLAALALGGLAVVALAVGASRMLSGRLTERRRTSSGRSVPLETVALFDALDEAHRHIAARLGAPRSPV